MIKHDFEIDIYGFTIHLVIVKNIYEAKEYYNIIREELNLKKKKIGLCEGFVYTRGFEGWIVFAEDMLTNSLIMHESTHLGMQISNYNNIKVYKDNEPFALLMGNIGKNIYDILKKYKIKIL